MDLHVRRLRRANQTGDIRQQPRGEGIAPSTVVVGEPAFVGQRLQDVVTMALGNLQVPGKLVQRGAVLGRSVEAADDGDGLAQSRDLVANGRARLRGCRSS